MWYDIFQEWDKLIALTLTCGVFAVGYYWCGSNSVLATVAPTVAPTVVPAVAPIPPLATNAFPSDLIDFIPRPHTEAVDSLRFILENYYGDLFSPDLIIFFLGKCVELNSIWVTEYMIYLLGQGSLDLFLSLMIAIIRYL